MKKLGVFAGVFLALILLAIVIIPLAVDVDRFRPKIVEAVENQINGKMELGRLSLSLWGQVRVEVAGLRVTDAAGGEVVGTKEAYFHIPIFSLLTGSPVLTFKLMQPSVFVQKTKSGKLNLTALKKTEGSKSTPPGTPPASQSPTPSSAKTQSPTPTGGAEEGLPWYVRRARLGIELLNASLDYRDEGTGKKAKVKNLNLVLKDLSLSRPTELEIWADLDTQIGEGSFVKGPVRLVGKAKTELKEARIHQVQVTARLDLNSLEVKMPDVFMKKKGSALGGDLAMTVMEGQAKVEAFQLNFLNAEVKGQGTISETNSDFKLESNLVKLGPWSEWLPKVKEYDVDGSLKFQADLHGSSQAPKYNAKLTVSELSVRPPQFKAHLRGNVAVNVVTDAIESIQAAFKGPGSDLTLQGKVVSFSKPKADLFVSSSSLDLDQMMDFPQTSPDKGKAQEKSAEKSQDKTPEKKKAPSGKDRAGKAGEKPSEQVDYDSMLAPLRENETLAHLEAAMFLNLKLIKAKKIEMRDLDCKLTLQRLTAGLNSCGLNVFSGKVTASTQADLKPKAPGYQFQMRVSGLDLKKALQSQGGAFQNFMSGKGNFDVKGTGKSFNTKQALSALQSSGSFQITEAKLESIDVSKIVQDAVQKAIGQLSAKVPGLKDQKMKEIPSVGSVYDVISSNFSIANGTLSAPNFFAKAAPKQGIDLKGKMTLGLLDYAVDSTCDVIDTYDVTHLKEISINQGGVKVEHILADGNTVHFPIHVGCTLTAPCYSYTEVPEFLSKVALNNIGKGISGHFSGAAQSEAEKALKKNAPPDAQKKLQEGLKGFFGH